MAGYSAVLGIEGFIAVLSISNADCCEHRAALLNRCIVPAQAGCSSKDFKWNLSRCSK